MLSTQTEALSNINKSGPCNTEITQTTASMSIIKVDAISPYGTEWEFWKKGSLQPLTYWLSQSCPHWILL